MILRRDFTTIWNLDSVQYHTALRLTPRSNILRGDRISTVSYCVESCFVGFFYSRWYDTAWSQAFILFYICLHFNSFFGYFFLFIILQATWCFYYFTGYVAMRNLDYGAWFIQAICEVRHFLYVFPCLKQQFCYGSRQFSVPISFCVAICTLGWVNLDKKFEIEK